MIIYLGRELINAYINSQKVTIATEKRINSSPDSYIISYDGISEANFSTLNPTVYKSTDEDITLINPTKTGYTFNGWTGSNGSTPELNVIIPSGSVGNKTYTANWIEKTATLTYNGNGSDFNISETMRYSTITQCINTIPSRNGYNFIKWNTKQDGTGVSYSSGNIVKAANTIPNNITLYAQWELLQIQTYTVSYNANGGSGAPSSQTKTKDVSLTLSSTKPTRSSISSSSYTVTFNANGGSVSPSSRTASNTTSYTFSNWSGSDGKTYSPGSTYVGNADLTLTAQWSSSTSRGSILLPTPTRSGYLFDGWYTSSSLSGTSYSDGTYYTPSSTCTLYASWLDASWSGASNSTIQSMLTKAYNGTLNLSNYWSIGDTRSVTINGVSTSLRLVNKGGKNLVSGGKCQYVVEFVGLLGTTKYNSGTELYPGSTLDSTLTSIYNNSNSFLQSILKQWNVIYVTDVDGWRDLQQDSSTWTGYLNTGTCSRYLAAPAAYEIQGSGKWGPDGTVNEGWQCAPLAEDNAIRNESGQFDYYKNLGVTYNTNYNYMIKRLNGSATEYWGRSPCSGKSLAVTKWGTNGIKTSKAITNSLGIAAIGCI